jgi:hypothetical protein
MDSADRSRVSCGYDDLSQETYLQVAIGACEHIQRDLTAYSENGTLCIKYFPSSMLQVHNANTLGAGLVARPHFHPRNEAFRELTKKAKQYTAKYQRPDGSWYYGHEADLHWMDNLHTAYILDSFKYHG